MERQHRPTKHPLGLALGLLILCSASPAQAGDTLDSLLRRGLEDLGRAQAAYLAQNTSAQHQFAKRAEERFTAARTLADGDLRVWFLGTQAAAFQGDRGLSATWYEGYRSRSVHRNTDPDLQFLQGFIYVFAGDNPDRAVGALRRMRALDGKRRPRERDTLLYMAHIRFAEVLLAKDDEHGAVKQFNEAARVSRRRGWPSKEMAATGNAGIALERAKEWKRASLIFEKLRKRDPANVLWHWHVGLCLASQLRFADALPVYRKVIGFLEAGRVAPAQLDELNTVYLRYGNSLRQVGDDPSEQANRSRLLAAAERNLKRFSVLYPKDARGYRWLGDLYYRSLERPHQAILAYAQALALDPTCGDVPLRSLVQIYTRNTPLPGVGTEEERQAAWALQLKSYVRQRDEGKERRLAAMRAREAKSRTRTDGCN